MRKTVLTKSYIFREGGGGEGEGWFGAPIYSQRNVNYLRFFLWALGSSDDRNLTMIKEKLNTE